MACTTDFIIIDAADNWGNINIIGVRSIELVYQGNVIPMESPADFTAEATSEWTALDFSAAFAFDTRLSKIGQTINNGWRGGLNIITNQRIYISFSVDQTFDYLTINNYHDTGTFVDRGIKNAKIYTTDPSIPWTPSVIYGEAIPGGTKIFDGVLSIHPTSDTIDDQDYGTCEVTVADLTAQDITTGIPTIGQPTLATPGVLTPNLRQVYVNAISRSVSIDDIKRSVTIADVSRKVSVMK